VVRHPFDRIVSAYKGKISRRDAKPRFYRKLQKEIKADYSKNKKDIKDGVPPTFEEYWRYLMDLTEDLVEPGDWRTVDCVQAFYSVCVPCDVEYDVILKLETHDDDTEFLIRQYNLTELQEPFTMWKHKSSGENQLGDYDYYLYDDPRRNPLPEFSKSLGGSGKDEEKEKKAEAKTSSDSKVDYKRALFGQLTEAQVLALYKNYKIDFDMFGYNVTEFLEYAQGSSDEKNEMDESEEEDEEEEDDDEDNDEEEDEEKEEEEDEEYEDEEEDGDDNEEDEEQK